MIAPILILNCHQSTTVTSKASFSKLTAGRDMVGHCETLKVQDPGLRFTFNCGIGEGKRTINPQKEFLAKGAVGSVQHPQQLQRRPGRQPAHVQEEAGSK